MRRTLDELIDNVLENETRRRIYMHLLRSPGDHYRGIMRALGIGNGNLSYHMQVMEKARTVKVRRTAGRTRFYPADMNPGPAQTDLRRSLMFTIATSPGVSDRELSAEYERSVRWIRENLVVLEDTELIGITRGSGAWRCFLQAPRSSDFSTRPGGMLHSPSGV